MGTPRLRVAVLLLLLLEAVAVAADTAHATVADFSAFAAALNDAAVSTIHLTGDIALDPLAPPPDASTISRNVTVAAAPGVAERLGGAVRIDFNFLQHKWWGGRARGLGFPVHWELPNPVLAGHQQLHYGPA